MVEKEIVNEHTKYFVKSSKEKKIVPNFLIEKDYYPLNLTLKSNSSAPNFLP